MPEIYVKYKPNLWCLMVHQAFWDLETDNQDIARCSSCDEYFFYPTKKKDKPVYTR